MSEKIISEEYLEKVVGGYNPNPIGEGFLYDGHMCKVIDNPPTSLSNSTWCCRLDDKGQATGVIIQVPNSMLP